MLMKLKTLINREFWEQRSVFFTTPMILGIIFVLVAACCLIISYGFSLNVNEITPYYSSFVADQVVPSVLSAIGLPFMLVMWLVIFYYFLGSLYDDRKDRSILFWQSMPVGQSQTIISKLFAGLILAPFCTWVAMMVTQVIILGLGSIFLLKYPILNWTILWSPAEMFKVWGEILGVMLLQGVWLLPLLTWCMLCSAYSNKAPALRAIVPLIILIVLEALLLKVHYISGFIFSRFTYASESWYLLSAKFQALVDHNQAIAIHDHVIWHADRFGTMWINLLIGLGLSAIFLVTAGWLRSRCYDFEK